MRRCNGLELTAVAKFAEGVVAGQEKQAVVGRLSRGVDIDQRLGAQFRQSFDQGLVGSVGVHGDGRGRTQGKVAAENRQPAQ